MARVRRGVRCFGFYGSGTLLFGGEMAKGDGFFVMVGFIVSENEVGGEV